MIENDQQLDLDDLDKKFRPKNDQQNLLEEEGKGEVSNQKKLYLHDHTNSKCQKNNFPHRARADFVK
jgi:hypothetical protein